MAVGKTVKTTSTKQISIIMQPSELYHSLHVISPQRLHTGIDLFAHKLVGRYKRRPLALKRLSEFASQVENLAASDIESLSPDLINKRLEMHISYFRRKSHSEQRITPEVLSALATLVKVCGRVLGLHPHKEQIIGALGLYSGYLIEMATGEGKSLTAALAATLTGWKNRPCHILTVNTYLAERDAEYFSAYYKKVGLTVGSVTDEMSADERRKQYKAHIVYTTSKELLADFLRDRLSLQQQPNAEQILVRDLVSRHSTSSLVLRGIDTAIIDEADSILIDEAVSPLIISSPVENQSFIDSIIIAKDLATHLRSKNDYEVDLEFRSISLTVKGKLKLEKLAAPLNGFWHGKARREELVVQSLVAREFFIKDKNYVIQDDQIVIIDEFTGRLTPGRSWSNGLHQAVEAKEDIKVTFPNETIARMSFQKFFRFFKNLSGMTGTAQEAAAEFWDIYELPSLIIPPHRPIRRSFLPTSIFKEEKEKWLGIIDAVGKLHGDSQPVLIGVRSIQESNNIALLLNAAGIPNQLLNAVNHQSEAEIVEEAGLSGRVTIATNMAGRGTDIKLDTLSREVGGLHIILSGLNDSGRIDRQLMGRCARQGDPGSVQVFLSFEDELLKRSSSSLHSKYSKLFQYCPIPYLRYFLFKASQKHLEKLAKNQRVSVLRADNWLEESLTFGSDY